MSAAGSSCFRTARGAAILRSRCAVRLACAPAVLVASACLPNQAHSSCGDYVVIGKPADSHAESSANEPARTAQHDAPRPCHGPNCQSAPRPLGIPLLPVNTVERTHENCLLTDLEAITSAIEPVRLCTSQANAPPRFGTYPPLWRPPEAA
jgi:hypothetical protein